LGEDLFADTLNFTDGSIEGLNRIDAVIDTVYNTAGTQVSQIEYVHLDEKSYKLQISHRPSSTPMIEVYKTTDITLDENGLIVGSELELESEHIIKNEDNNIIFYDIDDNPIKYNRYIIDEIFSDDIPYSSGYTLTYLSIVDENGDEVEYNIDTTEDYYIRIQDEVEFEYLVFTSIYKVSINSGNLTVQVESITGSISPGKTFIYPLDRLFDRTNIINTSEFDKGNYIVQYNRYPNRITGSWNGTI